MVVGAAIAWGVPAAILPASTAKAQAPADMMNTKHNLSVTGPGPVRALTETRICVFCHTPHNATPLSPLWNKDLEPRTYTVYTSPTLRAGPLPQPSGPTKLCLSCHDGTIALGAVLNPPEGIGMGGAALGTLSEFGLDLSGHHPVSFPYHASLPNPELVSLPPPDLMPSNTDTVHCTTCHDPHNDQYGRFLMKDNRYSALCISCHQMPGWAGSAHATSTASVSGILPRPPKTWPRYTQLKEWGCEACHTPHFAPTAEQLLNFTTQPPDPFSCTTSGCHSGTAGVAHSAAASSAAPRVAMVLRAPAAVTDIAQQIQKPSGHHEPLGVAPMRRMTTGGAARSGVRSVTCADCHNPHIAANDRAEAPYVSGLLRGVSGIDQQGMAITSATYEYEVCFKCHSDNTPDLNYVPRVVSVTNTRHAFETTNPSYHPVIGMGRNLNIPSIPSPFEPGMSPSVIIYCTTCHADDEGTSRGPHGSSFPPILKERYETADNTPETYDNYALCYRCHNRTSILNDASFRKTGLVGGHSGHLRAGATCSACHDPHGVYDLSAPGATGTGSHTHLINFDTRIVMPKTGNQYPFYTDKSRTNGPFSGSCTLLCHGVVHDNASYG